MSARAEILARIRARRVPARPEVSLSATPRARTTGDPVAAFVARARAAAAELRILACAEDVPLAIADVLRARNLAARICVPPDPKLAQLARSEVLECMNDPPGPDDAALAMAPFAIAETGTLAYPCAPGRPASWHFRAGLEIAILSRSNILPDLESVLERIAGAGALPSTLNLVTGPSRTGDIEQTLELGAHGPKGLVILVMP